MINNKTKIAKMKFQNLRVTSPTGVSAAVPVISNNHFPLGSFRCGQNCTTCPYLTNGLTGYTFHVTGGTRSITSHITCNIKNVIYMVQCNRCNLQFVGETKRRLKDRFLTNTDVQSTKLTLNLNPLLFLNTFSLTLTILILTCS